MSLNKTFLSLSFFLHPGVGPAVRDGRQVLGHAPDRAAADQVRPEAAGQDAVAVQRGARPLEQPQDEGVARQAEAGASHTGGVGQHHKGEESRHWSSRPASQR